MKSFKSLQRYRSLRKQERRIQLDYEKQSNNTFGNCTLYNWWEDHDVYLWFVRRYQDLLEDADKKISFCSVFGKREVLAKVNGIKVFYSGENVHRAPYDEYADYLLIDKTTSLGLGFDCFEDARYVRFPLWILYMFKPTSSREDVVDRCDELRYPDVSGKTRFCSMVASHDFDDIRGQMVQRIKAIDAVSCGGKYLHNDDSLKTDYNDNKIRYLKSFYFNICPENSNCCGYVTEKLFEAISSGCIPIYWGSFNAPEPRILNPEAILFWNKDKYNNAVVQRIEQLISTPCELNELLHLPRLQKGAEDVVWEMFEKLDSVIIKLLKA